jgi:transposase-like protein
MPQRKKYTGKQKADIALEAIRGEKTVQEISSKYGVHPNQVTKWKQEALKRLPEALEDKRCKDSDTKELEKERDEQLKKIGELTMQINWLKKKLGPYL